MESPSAPKKWSAKIALEFIKKDSVHKFPLVVLFAAQTSIKNKPAASSSNDDAFDVAELVTRLIIAGIWSLKRSYDN